MHLQQSHYVNYVLYARYLVVVEIIREADEKNAAGGMDRIAKTLFKSIYPVIAGNAGEETGISEGVCVDLGSGPASLAIAMAAYPGFRIYALDHSPASNEIAEKNIENAGLSERITVLKGPVEKIPLESGIADLIVSRGSAFFWEDYERAFSEIGRILKPGGRSYIGGGFGNAELRDSIVEEMIRRDPDWEKKYRRNMSPDMKQTFLDNASKLKDCSFRCIDDETGLWIIIEKKVEAS